MEQDGCKVMLVANEAEFIKHKEKEYATESEKQINELCENFSDLEDKSFTKTTKEYLSKKEKTISDTIQFVCDFENSLKSIISTFANTTLSLFADDKCVKEIKNICEYENNFNLRALIFACQKAADIYKEIKDIDNEFAKAIFYSIVAFSLKMNSGKDIGWKGNSLFSPYLGFGQYPLFHFCYHYIMEHTFIKKEIESAKKDYREYKLNAQENIYSNNDLNTLYSYYLHYEKDLLQALKNIEKDLKEDIIPYVEYGKIANYIISLKWDLNIDISNIKLYLINNLKGKKRELEMNIRISSGMEMENDVKRKEYLELQEEMVMSLNYNRLKAFDFTNTEIDDFCKEVEYNINEFHTYREFACLINIENFIERIKNCSPAQILRVRRCFGNVYASVNIKEILFNDKDNIDKLILEIEKLLKYDGLDNVQKLQCKWFLRNLNDISKKLEY